MTKAEKINIAIGIGQLLVAVLLFLGFDRKSMPDFSTLRTWTVLLLNLGGWVFIAYAVYLGRKTARQLKETKIELDAQSKETAEFKKESAAFKREIDEMYADVILDWLQHNHPAIFPTSFVAERMQLNLEKVTRGLKILENEFKVVQDHGARGWSYNPMASVALICQYRRLVPVKISN